MKCVNCGCNNSENSRFCQSCGSALDSNQNSVSVLMFQLVNDNIFMGLCILISVSLGFALIDGSVSIIRILMTVFLWLIFSKRKNENINFDYYRYISGTIFASYFIKWVVCCLTIVYGLIIAVLSFTISTEKLWDIFGIESYMKDFMEGLEFLADFYLLFVAVILIIFAIAGIFLNVFGWRTIHHFAQSVYKSIECGEMIFVEHKTAQTWMIVFGILNGIKAVLALSGGNSISFLDKGCLSAVFIMGGIITNKYFQKMAVL